jgi:ATP-dependent Clp protease ATP-binding subunit ClpC
MASGLLAASGITVGRLREEITRLPGRPGSGAPAPAEALAAIGIDVDEIRRRADANFGSGRFVFTRPAYTPRAKEALMGSLSAAQTLDDEDIDTQHLLLGLLAEDEGRAVTVLRALGADPGGLRSAVLGRAAPAS